MANLSKFHLLHLPQLPLDEVLSSMVPLELFNLSKLSRACQRMIKAFSKRRIHKNYEVCLMVYQNPEINFYQNTTKYSFTLTNEIEKDGTRRSYIDRWMCESMYMYSENLMNEFMRLFMEIREIFNVGVDEFHFHLNLFKDSHSTILNWLNSNFQTIGYALVDAQMTTVGYLEHVLSSLSNVKKVQIAGDTSERSAINIPDHFKRVIIDCGEWIRLEHLVDFKAPIINISGGTLTNTDLNSFLRSWINMDQNQNLKSFDVCGLNPFDLETVLQDVPHEIAHRVVYHDPNFEPLDHGVDIVRMDGLIASIYVYQMNRFFIIVMSTRLADSE